MRDLIVYEAAKIEDMLNQWMFLARPEPPRKTEIVLVELIAQDRARAGSRCGACKSSNCESPRRPIGACRRTFIASARFFTTSSLTPSKPCPKAEHFPSPFRKRTFVLRIPAPVFQPTALRRAANTLYSEKEGGMGLGLNVARKIVRAHDGHLSIGNRTEGGAVVRVIL